MERIGRKNDWEMARKNALDRLGELQKKDYGNIYPYLLEAAATIADVLCEADQRFSILELISASGSKNAKPNAYKILFANPQNSLRHSISEIGMLNEPQEKLALTEAIKKQHTLIANHVPENPLTRYIGVHIGGKGLKHMAVMPLEKYLLVFDRVSCDEPFGEKEERFLANAARIISFGFRWYLKNKRNAKRKGDILRDVLADKIGNPVMVIGGFYRRLDEASRLGDENKALAYAEIIAKAAKQLVDDLALIQEIKSFMSASQNNRDKITRTLLDYLKVFGGDDFETDESISRLTFNLNHSEKMLKQLFNRIRNFMLGNRLNHDLSLRLASYGAEHVTIEFRCTGFKKMKTEIDENLFCISGISEVLGGQAEVGDDYLLITLPLAQV